MKIPILLRSDLHQAKTFQISGIALNAAGDILVAGTFTDVRTVGTQQVTGPSVFLHEYGANNALLFAWYGRGNAETRASDLVADSQGNFYLAGATTAADFPVLGGVQSATAGQRDAFVAKFVSGQPNSIEGYVFDDANANGKRDFDDAGLPDVTVYLDANNDGDLDTTETLVQTDATGHYAFLGLSSSTPYNVRVVGNTGYYAVMQAAFPVLLNGQNQGIDFGMRAVPADSRVVQVGSYHVDAGQVITVPIELSDASRLLSADLVLTYDATLLDISAADIQLGSLTKNFSLLPTLSSGTVALRIFGTVSPSGKGTLASLDFHVKAGANGTSAVHFKSLSLNSRALASVAVDGAIQVGYPDPIPQADTFQVVDFQQTPSGFNVRFNHDLDLTKVQLFGNSADVSIVGRNTGVVVGSALWDKDSKTLQFIKTGALLAPDVYMVRLGKGGSINQIQDTTAQELDGNRDGFPGDDYIHQFLVEPDGARVVSLPDLARGSGQPLNVSTANVTGEYTFAPLPIQIDRAAGVAKVDFVLTYDPLLLNVSPVAFDADMPLDWQMTADTSTAGRIVVTASGSALTASVKNLFRVPAVVPNGAAYGTSELLHWESLSLFDAVGGGLAATGDDAIHKVAYFGNASGDPGYSALDAAFVARANTDPDSPELRVDDRFAAFPLTDPRIVGDIDGNGQIDSLDASFVLKESVGLLVLQIPALPSVLPPSTPASIDPVVTVSSTTVLRGQDFQISMTIDTTLPGLRAFNLDINYDAAVLTTDLAKVQLGSLLPAVEWSRDMNLEQSKGRLRFGAFRSIDGFLMVANGGELLKLGLHANETAPSGPSPVELKDRSQDPEYNIGRSALDGGRLLLTPVAGTVTVSNRSPVAVQDRANVSEGTANNFIDVLNNDTDPDNLPPASPNTGIKVVAVARIPSTTHGTVSVAANGGGVIYTPDLNFYYSEDTFTYTVSDGSATATGTVTVSVRQTASGPTVTLTRAANEPNDMALHFTATFSAPVSGFDRSDIVVSVAGQTPGVIVVPISPSNGRASTYEIFVTGVTRAGTLTLTINEATAFDAAGHGNIGLAQPLFANLPRIPLIPTVTQIGPNLAKELAELYDANELTETFLIHFNRDVYPYDDRGAPSVVSFLQVSVSGTAQPTVALAMPRVNSRLKPTDEDYYYPNDFVVRVGGMSRSGTITLTVRPNVVQSKTPNEDGSVDGNVAAARTVDYTMPADSLSRMWQVYNPNGKFNHFTTSTGEAQALIKAGYQDKSSNLPGFVVHSAPVPGWKPLHRLYNPNTSQHYYTPFDGELSVLITGKTPNGVAVRGLSPDRRGWVWEKDEGTVYPRDESKALDAQVPSTVTSGSERLAKLSMVYFSLPLANGTSPRGEGDHVYSPDPKVISALTARPGWSLQSSPGFVYLIDRAGKITDASGRRIGTIMNRLLMQSAAIATPVSASIELIRMPGFRTDESSGQSAVSIAVANPITPAVAEETGRTIELISNANFGSPNPETQTAESRGQLQQVTVEPAVDAMATAALDQFWESVACGLADQSIL